MTGVPAVVAVRVDVPPAPYDVLVGSGILGEVATTVGDRRRVAVVSQARVAELYAARLLEALPSAELFLMGDGEDHKTIATVGDLARRFAAAGLLRDDAVVALGGGVVGDTAGFAAAVYHRGVDVVQVPTTLLAQVDSAIGGKTGVNLPEGKNLVGAFHQPIGVVADVATLADLPAREYRSGLGEVAKYALLEGVGGELDTLLREESTAVLGREPTVLADLVRRCATIKARVVAGDPEERTGSRATLNLGHTLAHALETAGRHRLTHGEAVAVGLVFAGALAEATGRIDAATADRYRSLPAALGLPVRVPAGPAGGAAGGGTDGASEGDDGVEVGSDALLALMRRDKKAAGGFTFVLPGPGGVERVDDPPAGALARAFAAVGVRG